MDAAMAHRERKQLNFSTIVDFSLLKQGIFFVTLRQVKSSDTSLKIRCVGAFFLPIFKLILTRMVIEIVQ